MTINPIITNYITSRENFYNIGGKNYLNARNELRSEFCKTTLTFEDLKPWLKSIPSGFKFIQDEAVKRIKEWEFKIAKGALERTDQALTDELSMKKINKAFEEKINVFYITYFPLLLSPEFTEFNETRAALRETLAPQIKTYSPEVVIEAYGITDPELQNRIKFEWPLKV